MRRISSLPTAEFCSRVDKIGQDIETTQSARSTIFHAYCDTGKWPADLRTLPEADIEEISKWRIPMPFVYTVGNTIHALPYLDAIRERRVATDVDFKPVEVPSDIPVAEVKAKFPNVMMIGHLDMAWVLPQYDLVIICDIKSSIFAVKDRCDSLQLHGYGMAMCAITGVGRYLTAIWDASDGRYYVAGEPVEFESFKAEEIRDRIRLAATEREGDFRTGTHCSGCWKRSSCPAHLRDVPEGEFSKLLAGKAMEADVREAIVKLKQLGDLSNKVGESIKAWVSQHGPVRSEDGRKQYQCEMRAGRESLDKSKICRALGVENLDAFMSKGKDYPVFDWRKRD